MPSFASLIARVKPAVVSVKVKVVHDASDQSNLPSQIRQFFPNSGEQATVIRRRRSGPAGWCKSWPGKRYFSGLGAES
jgi:hypothetical protein